MTNIGSDAVTIRTVGPDGETKRDDLLAIEEPLEIQLGFVAEGKRTFRSLSITMRTPGHDFDLAAGFLLSEGIVRDRSQIASIRHCGTPTARGLHNTVRIELDESVAVDFTKLERHFYTTSSCGVCGKSSLEALEIAEPPKIDRDVPVIASEVIHALPAHLRAEQSVFEQTGGLHAAALFDANGALVIVREDVGRHNAVDKVLGSLFLTDSERRAALLFVSGRASFELMQKALMSGVPILAAVGAPSTLAVDLARRFDLTLIGFVRDDRFNVYAGEWRVRS